MTFSLKKRAKKAATQIEQLTMFWIKSFHSYLTGDTTGCSKQMHEQTANDRMDVQDMELTHHTKYYTRK